MAAPALHMLMAAGQAAGFDPLSISGCKLWLDADDAAQFTYSSGVVVSQWSDKSGTGNHFAQSTVTNQPSRNGSQNGHTAVVFDGVDNLLTRTALIVQQPDTVLCAIKYNTRGFGEHFIDCSNNNYRQMVSGSDKWRIYTGSGDLDSGVAGDTSWHQITGVFNGASSVIRKDGTQIATGNTGTGQMGHATDSTVAIGAGAASAGFAADIVIGEILVYNTALGSTDRDAVEAYLKAKWGTP